MGDHDWNADPYPGRLHPLDGDPNLDFKGTWADGRTGQTVIHSTAKPLIYVAGPITADPFGCVRQALGVFGQLRELGWTPILPQLTVIAEMIEHRDYEEWLAWDFDLIGRCDAVLRLPGHSPGADREVEHARSLGIKVYEHNDEWGGAWIPRAADPNGHFLVESR